MCRGKPSPSRNVSPARHTGRPALSHRTLLLLAPFPSYFRRSLPWLVRVGKSPRVVIPPPLARSCIMLLNHFAKGACVSRKEERSKAQRAAAANITVCSVQTRKFECSRQGRKTCLKIPISIKLDESADFNQNNHL